MTELHMDKLADVISEVISSKSALENCEALEELADGFPLSGVL